MIVADDLVKRFGDTLAVDHVSLRVEAGDVLALLGRNGAGKSTTVHMLTTILRPTSGRIRIDGIDPAVNPRGVRARLGIVFQDPTLDPELTVHENLDLHAVLYGVARKTFVRRSEELLHLLGLAERRHTLVRALSGGTRRRLEIARALLHAPKVLLLDEPTVGLDPPSRSQMWAYVRHMNEVDGVTVLLTTHNLDEAERVARRVTIIDAGRIMAQGSSEELRRRTQTGSLDEAFLALTGAAMEAERPMAAADLIRRSVTAWRR